MQKMYICILAGDFFDELLYCEIARKVALTYKYKRLAALTLVEAQIPMHILHTSLELSTARFTKNFDEFVDYEMERFRN